MSACHYLPSCRHLLVKWFGVCLAVASGLAVGPEGPMIFIGTDLSHSALAAALHGRGLIRVCRGASIGYFFSRLRVIQIFGVDRLHQIEWIRIPVQGCHSIPRFGDGWALRRQQWVLAPNCSSWTSRSPQLRLAGDDVFTRDYTSIGAACGIAAAFRAPIAGCTDKLCGQMSADMSCFQ